MATFYKTILKEVNGNVLDDVYPHLVGTKDMPTLEERLGNKHGECPDCRNDNPRWMLLPEECVAVTEGGKAYIECLDCGYITHL